MINKLIDQRADLMKQVNYIDKRIKLIKNAKKIVLEYNLIKIISDCSGISIELIQSKKRNKDIVNCRRIFAYICYFKIALSLHEIGDVVNKTTRSVYQARDTYQDFYLQDVEFRQLADKCLNEFNRIDVK